MRRLSSGGWTDTKRLRLIYKAVMDSVESEFETVGNSEFIENIVQVIFHRLFADEEFFADFAVAESLRDKLNDFFFAVAQQRLFAALAGLRRLLESVNHFRGHAVIEPDFAVGNLANAFHAASRWRIA